MHNASHIQDSNVLLKKKKISDPLGSQRSRRVASEVTVLTGQDGNQQAVQCLVLMGFLSLKMHGCLSAAIRDHSVYPKTCIL